MENKGGRPVKEWRTKINGAQLMIYHNKEYVGSISFKELAKIVSERRSIGKGVVLASSSFLKDGGD